MEVRIALTIGQHLRTTTTVIFIEVSTRCLIAPQSVCWQICGFNHGNCDPRYFQSVCCSVVRVYDCLLGGVLDASPPRYRN